MFLEAKESRAKLRSCEVHGAGWKFEFLEGSMR